MAMPTRAEPGQRASCTLCAGVPRKKQGSWRGPATFLERKSNGVLDTVAGPVPALSSEAIRTVRPYPTLLRGEGVEITPRKNGRPTIGSFEAQSRHTITTTLRGYGWLGGKMCRFPFAFQWVIWSSISPCLNSPGVHVFARSSIVYSPVSKNSLESTCILLPMSARVSGVMCLHCAREMDGRRG